jgi:Uma2 family endonuclease
MAITRYSVDDYEEMIRVGKLTKRDRVELIRGEIVPKKPISPRHASCNNRLNRLLHRMVSETAIVSAKNPIRLDDSVPEPSFSLQRPRDDWYASGYPRRADLMLVIEVADSSLDYDRDVKKPTYAQSGITEYWIVNLVDECLEVCRGPQPDGTYQEEWVLNRGESTDILALPGLVVAVDELF